MIARISTTFAALAGLSLVVATPAAALKVGDPAPPVQAGKWLQGEPVTKLEGDKVYFFEFWATWCGPCIAAIPHVNGLHQKYKDRGLVVIGQNVWENNTAGVPGFVTKMADKMTYRVAMDDTSDGSRGRMATTWLAAAGQKGIPCAMLVGKDGKLAFIGHPMRVTDAQIEALLDAPSTKPSAAPTAEKAPAAPSQQALELAKQAATEIAAGRLDEAEAALNRLNDELGDTHREVSGLLYLDLLLARKQTGEAIELARMIAEDFAKSPAVLATVAEKLVARPDASAALQAAAEKIAAPVASGDSPAKASALATQARIAMLGGDQDRAVELQTKVIALQPDSVVAKSALEAYQRGRLP